MEPLLRTSGRKAVTHARAPAPANCDPEGEYAGAELVDRVERVPARNEQITTGLITASTAAARETSISRFDQPGQARLNPSPNRRLLRSVQPDVEEPVEVLA